MPQRALIIGSDRDYCYVIKEFLELRELYVTVVLDYKDGLDRLSYEKPDLTIIEDFGKEIDRALIETINTKNEFEIVDFINTRRVEKDRKRILVFEDRNHITFLFNFLKFKYSDIEASETSRDSEDTGSLRSTFYPGLLIDIYSKKRTGILSITSSANLHIYFVNGSPIFAEGGDIETAIGRILLDRGKLSREDYEKALEIAGEKKQKFGETLFGMGLISPHELNLYLELQMEEKIIRGFHYLSGKYAFSSGDNFTDRVVSYKVNLHKVVHEGVLRFIDAEPIEKENPVIEITAQLNSEINNLGLKPKELRFVQLLKNKARVAEILETSTLGRDETLKLLYFLALFKLVEFPDTDIDTIGRASMEKHLRERDLLPAGEKSDLLLQFDEQGLFAENAGTTDTQPGFPNQPGEDSPTGEGAQLFGSTGKEEGPTGVEAEEHELEDFKFLHESESREGAETVETETGEPRYDIFSEDVNHTTASKDPIEPGAEKEEIISHLIDYGRPGDTQGEQAAEAASDDGTRDGADSPETYDAYDAAGEFELDLAYSSDGTDTGNGGTSGETDTDPERAVRQEDSPDLKLDRPDQPLREQESPDDTNDLIQAHGEETGDGSPPAEIETGSRDCDTQLASEEASPSVPEGKTGSETAKIYDSRQVAERVNEFYAKMNKQDHYEVLGVGRDASGEDIRDAYYRLVKFYHPDVTPDSDYEIREKSEEIFTRITSAYETLKETEKREQYDSQAELAELRTNAKYIYEAEMAFKKGITLLVQRDYTGAEKKIREALNMNPEEPAYLGAHAWTLFLSEDDKPRIEGEAINSLEKAISMNDKIPENYYYLGSIYKHRNDLTKAEEYFNKAVKLDPDYIEVKREIRLINTRKTSSKNEKQPGKNFWSGLFKK